jgi:hypothetical protein
VFSKFLLLLGIFFNDPYTIELHVKQLEVNHYNCQEFDMGLWKGVPHTQLIVWNSKGEFVDSLVLMENEWKPDAVSPHSPMIIHSHGKLFRIYYNKGGESWTVDDPVKGLDGDLFFPNYTDLEPRG